jgi:hypothetical protein
MHYPSGTFVRHHREMDEIGTRTCALKFFECIAGTEINLRMLFCRSGFSRDLFMGADNSPLTEGPLPLAGARGIWCGADLSAIDMGRRYRENRS